jgi:hypothetical protein
MTPATQKHLDVAQPQPPGLCPAGPADPVGDLCVLPDASHTHWLVSICLGSGNRQVLRRFECHASATEWAIDERARRMQVPGAGPVVIHFPDDCPCHGSEPSTW